VPVWLTVIAVLFVQSACVAGSLPPLASCPGHGAAPVATAQPGHHARDGSGDPHAHDGEAAAGQAGGCSELLCPECRALYGAHLLALPTAATLLPTRPARLFRRPGGYSYRAPFLPPRTPPPICRRPA